MGSFGLSIQRSPVWSSWAGALSLKRGGWRKLLWLFVQDNTTSVAVWGSACAGVMNVQHLVKQMSLRTTTPLKRSENRLRCFKCRSYGKKSHKSAEVYIEIKTVDTKIINLIFLPDLLSSYLKLLPRPPAGPLCHPGVRFWDKYECKWQLNRIKNASTCNQAWEILI